MKNILFSLLITIILVSCSKYEEGPFVCFKSPEKRITKLWTLKEYYVNDEFILINDLGIEIWEKTYNPDGTGIQTIQLIGMNPVNENFEWKFNEKKDSIFERFRGSNNEWSDFYSKKIIRLSSNDLWIVEKNNNEEIKYFFGIN
ncbi:MAG TPA: hypothetical protein PLC87_10635 [Bacteroidales bacterium]|nr:hypothetical protein [Bacteroidales bacterium]HOL98910.1 hypothetical protein [Bacteroidales bacterium]